MRCSRQRGVTFPLTSTRFEVCARWMQFAVPPSLFFMVPVVILYVTLLQVTDGLIVERLVASVRSRSCLMLYQSSVAILGIIRWSSPCLHALMVQPDQLLHLLFMELQLKSPQYSSWVFGLVTPVPRKLRASWVEYCVAISLGAGRG